MNASSGTAEIPLPPVGYHYGSDQWLIDDETNWDGSVSVSNTNTLKLTNCSVPNTYTINFVGGEGATGTTASVNATYDTPTTLTDNGFTKSGYKFAGWDTDAIADEVVYSNGSQVLNLTSEQEGTVPLYAVWTAKENVPAPNVTAETKTYNGQDQSLELSGFTVKYTQDGQEATPVDVGTYDLEIIKDETNDTAAYHSYLYAALTIEPAELIVAAEDKSMYVNDPLPVFTCTISGWQGDDGKNVAMPDPQATCSANGKTAGTYDIIPGHINAGDNYKVIYEKGKLTVSKHSSSNTTTSTTTNNPDGSTTTTTTDKTTGTVTETTKAADGTTVVATTDKQGNTTVTANVPAAAVDAAKGEAVALPTTVSAGESVKITAAKETKVEIPVENVTPGTVAVIVKADGTEEILKTSLPTEDGVVLTVEGDATVKIVDNAKEFVDVNPVNHWAEDAIDFVTAREMFTGTSETTFSPDVPMTRAQLMTVLARFDGQDTNGGATWYEKGMEWAKANGVSDGSNPSGSITREQLATMLWRYSGSPVVEGSMDHFTDAEAVSDYAADAMRWAVETGLISGVDNNTLDPQGNATRAQLATILMRFCQNLAE
ncbi:MAG: S-layer homology domain-containing protein [Bacillota bacterium]|nr:S-layer homology domain-containing protein [Bacillota bacterium]